MTAEEIFDKYVDCYPVRAMSKAAFVAAVKEYVNPTQPELFAVGKIACITGNSNYHPFLIGEKVVLVSKIEDISQDSEIQWWIATDGLDLSSPIMSKDAFVIPNLIR